MVPRHLFSAEEHGLMQQHYNRASILQALFMHWPLSVKPCTMGLIHYPERERQKVKMGGMEALSQSSPPAALSSCTPSHGSPPSSHCECVVPAQQAFIVIESAAYKEWCRGGCLCLKDRQLNPQLFYIHTGEPQYVEQPQNMVHKARNAWRKKTLQLITEWSVVGVLVYL